MRFGDLRIEPLRTWIDNHNFAICILACVCLQIFSFPLQMKVRIYGESLVLFGSTLTRLSLTRVNFCLHITSERIKRIIIFAAQPLHQLIASANTSTALQKNMLRPLLAAAILLIQCVNAAIFGTQRPPYGRNSSFPSAYKRPQVSCRTKMNTWSSQPMWNEIFRVFYVIIMMKHLAIVLCQIK